MKAKLVWQLVLLGVCAVSILLLNYYTVPGGDEMCYAFAGQNTGYIDNPARVHSFYDLLVQQWRDYHCHGNGRVLLQLVNGTFSWLRLYTLFRVLNAAMWFVFVWLILKSAWGKIDLGKYIVGFAFVFWFFWYAETAACNACFSLAYLWVGCLAVTMVGIWQKPAKWWLLPLSAFFGLTQECYVLPFLGATLGACCVRVAIKRQFSISWIKIASWLLILTGACFLCFGPASRMRANACTGGLGVAMLAGVVHLALVVTPVVLLALVAWILIKKRASALQLVAKDVEWWMLLVAGLSLWLLVCNDVFLRTGVSWFVASMVLVLKHHECFTLKPKTKKVLVGLSLGWLVIAAIIQINTGMDGYRMLDVYKADAQGVTCYDGHRKGLFAYTCSDNALNGWYRWLFQLEYAHERPMTVLPKNVYDALYLDSKSYFAQAREVACDVYAVDGFENVYVQKGWGKSLPGIRAQEDGSRYFAGWKRFVPGRVMREITSPNKVVVPGGRVEIRTKSGDEITLYDFKEVK